MTIIVKYRSWFTFAVRSFVALSESFTFFFLKINENILIGFPSTFTRFNSLSLSMRELL